MNRTFIVAEAGVNHNGSLDTALELVDAALNAGADAVKFQTFRAAHLSSSWAPKAPYQTKLTEACESQLEMLKKLELGRKDHAIILRHCYSVGIEFLSTPFDMESLDFLIKKLRVERVKISSGDVTNAPLLLKAAGYGVPVILSTGISTLDEIRMALSVLAFGYRQDLREPSPQNFREAYASESGKRLLKEKVTLLQCTTEYPAPLAETNLRAMETMHSKFGLPVGFSDHTEGIAAAVAAAAREAVVIEKHLTLDKKMPGPDHHASLDPDEMKMMVSLIRQVELALGVRMKRPSPSELKNRDSVRKSLIAACPIREGEVFTADQLAIKRPGTGISPLYFWDYLGKRARKSFRKNDLIE